MVTDTEVVQVTKYRNFTLKFTCADELTEKRLRDLPDVKYISYQYSKQKYRAHYPMDCYIRMIKPKSIEWFKKKFPLVSEVKPISLRNSNIEEDPDAEEMFYYECGTPILKDSQTTKDIPHI